MLRGYLRASPQKVFDHSVLKEKLAKEFPFDMNSYKSEKIGFIVQIMNEMGMDKINPELI